MSERASIQAIYRYPVKGLSAEPLRRARLEPGQTIAADRRYAIENGPSGFDPAEPSYLPKNRFLMLMRDERLARLESHYDEQSDVLSLRSGGQEVARGALSTREGRKAIEDFFAVYCADELRGPPRLLQAPGHSFSDVARKVVSVINLASLAAVETAVGSAVHPLRFRGNLYVAGWPAWHEFDLVGQELAIGSSARLRVRKRIERCAAIDVDPETGMRDIALLRLLDQTFGHTACGVYAESIASGEIAVGDQITDGEVSDVRGA